MKKKNHKPAYYVQCDANSHSKSLELTRQDYTWSVNVYERRGTVNTGRGRIHSQSVELVALGNGGSGAGRGGVQRRLPLCL